jgi:hypothetical protein
MRAPTDGSPTDSTPWQFLASSTRGAAHRAAALANEDAHAWRVFDAAEGPVAVAAVADGHGHRRHFRAERGARLAVEHACRFAEAHGQHIDRIGGESELEEFGREIVVPTVLEDWRRAVAADLDRDAFTPEEEAVRASAGDDPVIAYGATLLMALLGDRFVLVSQIGDGDVVALGVDGAVDDPTLDGHHTTSLCQPSAAASFRLAVIDQAAHRLTALLMATDGFGNAQASEPWPPAVGADIASMLGRRGTRWVGEQLPLWTARCASTEGSGDDTTVILAVRRP